MPPTSAIVPVHGSDADPDGSARFDAWAEVFVASARSRFGDEHDAWAADELRAMEGNAARGRLRYAWQQGGEVVGGLDLILPSRENTDLVECHLAVLPERRGEGIEDQLLAWAGSQARAEGRTRMTALTSWAEGQRDGEAEFWSRHGFTPAQFTLRSDLPLPMPGPPATAPGYVLESAVDGIPPEWHADRAVLSMRMSTDAPMGELAHEPEHWDADRIAAEIAQTATMGRRSVETVARHVASGQLVGFTHVEVPAGTPDRAYQHDTLVLREHRGHGLGLALKVANTLALQDHMPGVRYVRTWNAVENEPMLRVNRELGYAVTAHLCEWQAVLH